MGQISLGNIILANNGKRGILKPNGDGVYCGLNAGGFNIDNAHGISYPFNEYLQSQVDKNSDLNRRVKMGYCKMEADHPKPYVYVIENGIRYRKDITDLMEWIARLRDYDRDRICAVIRQIHFIFDDENDFSKPVYNKIDVEPIGVYGPQFKESLESPSDNTAVSIRTQISPFKPGQKQKNVEYWTGYDWVFEPGMIHANKHMSAGCESFLSDMHLGDGNMVKFKASDVIEKLDSYINHSSYSEEELARVGGLEALNSMAAQLEATKQAYRRYETVTVGVSLKDVF